ncbi:PPC domain-containing DNA-binding protein [Fibrella aquatica]|uniref:PPC domain-containing DNA-binding protein n=1 Tax=Fibrella aquatica TaxID=3242487 RepID=UPI0035201458
MRFLLLFSLFSQFLTMPEATAQTNPPIGQKSPMVTFSFRMKPGQDLKEELDRVVREERIEAGLILTCVGSLTDASLRLANQEKATTYTGHFEIVSLVGTLSLKGSHVHLSVSDSTGRTLGGHLMPGNKIYTTAEIVIGILPDLLYTREPDPTFSYRELVVRKKKRK